MNYIIKNQFQCFVDNSYTDFTQTLHRLYTDFTQNVVVDYMSRRTFASFRDLACLYGSKP